MSLFSLLISRLTSTIVRWKNTYFVVERLTKSNGVVKSNNTKVERLFYVVNSPLLSDGTSFSVCSLQYVLSGQITTESENNLSKIRFFGEIITRKLLVFS